ncbi:hypothetical protein [Streptomyces sp. MMBL 11-1]|uniref:hypothetical protein n=1 Tax=Streptomyces sp. MMBL 11-1 TaxID=3026420 RepID=UPI00235FDADB|nr:hypothetical protein [Streptomyces sp. MMBL 11-1]
MAAARGLFTVVEYGGLRQALPLLAARAREAGVTGAARAAATPLRRIRAQLIPGSVRSS